jgi:hypothetical protein
VLPKLLKAAVRRRFDNGDGVAVDRQERDRTDLLNTLQT